jgi:hypothetical protein
MPARKGGWLALAFLSVTGVRGLITLTTTTAISPIGLATLLFGLVGESLLFIAVLVGLLHSVRTRQQR